ncbi:hypothetical protein H5410_000345 [Solanum commersonii]|uniref:Pectinesterase inhibitor domain-containing protein n=1 Tax=Solanum commersonii TaxID=4109 RepID=A0A9J6AW04_SOLCO|nr:hypothetical protein H5410_000345 [Solanum commersonii]
MAPLTKITFLVIAISFFLTIPSNAFDYTLKTSLSAPSSLPTPKTPTTPKPQILDGPVQKVVVASQNVPSFVKATMVGTMSKTQEFIKNVIEKRLALSAKMDHYRKDCLETCKEVYGDAIDAMKKASQDVKSQNFYKANMDLSAMYSYIETCHDCVVETKENDLAFQNFEKWAKGVASDCLDKVSKEYYKN